MTRRRDMLLDEMGLAPRWRLRGTVAVPPPLRVAPEEPLVEQEPGPVSSSSAFSGGGPAERGPGSSLAAAEKEPGPFLAEQQRVDEPDEKGPGSFAESASHDPPDAVQPPPREANDAGRIAQVMQMDWPTLATTVAGCTVCGLSTTRNCTVFGVGDRRARWLLVGEGPGAEEDARGEPFVGQSGRLLDNMLAALDMKRGKDVFIANIVKCRPPDNRVPSAAEVQACEPYLHRQIELVQPKVIIALGKTAAVTLLGKERSIASMRGQVFRYRDTPLIVTYHPAYLLRSLPEKAKAWEDLCFARARVREWSEEQALASRDSVPISPS